MPDTLSRLQDTRFTASQEEYETNVAHLGQQVEALSVMLNLQTRQANDVEVEANTLALGLTDLKLRLSENPVTRPPFAKAIPDGFTKSLGTISAQWNCDQFTSDALSAPAVSTADGAFLDKTRSTISRRESETSQTARYENMSTRDMADNARTRYLSENPIKLIFDDNRQYLILLIILIFIGGTRYFFQRLKKFEARETRRVLNRLIQVRLNGRVHDFYLVDLSRNGAKLNHPGTIKRESSVQIGLIENWHVGQIKWYNDLYAGVLFKTPLDEDTFNENVAQA